MRMNKAEMIQYLEFGPDDAEVVIADYVGDDLEIGDMVYFPKEKIFWIRTADLIAETEDNVFDNEAPPEVLGPTIFLPSPKDVQSAIDVEVVPVDVIVPKGRQRAA
jgi:hypothetical protein